MDFSILSDLKPQAGTLLISEPFLPDPNFERTVVLLCMHDENGSFGFVLNKQTELTIGQVMQEHGSGSDKIYLGGPVQPDSLHFLHTLGDKIPGSESLGKGIYWGGDFMRLKEMMDLKMVSPSQYRFFVGYSGWAAGQLDQELTDKSWIVSGSFDHDIFNYEPANMWRIVLNAMGGKFRLISNYPADPRLN